MKKDISVNLKMDSDTARLLQALADMYFDGNRSTTLRQLVKRAAREQGIAAGAKEREAA